MIDSLFVAALTVDALALCLIAAMAVPWSWLFPAERQRATDAQRREKLEALRIDYPDIVDDKVTTLLLDQAEKSAKTKIEGLRSVESKAAGQIALVATGLGAISFLGPKEDAETVTGLLIGALCFFLLSFLANVICLLPSRYGSPSVDKYWDDETVRFPSSKPRIELEITGRLLKQSQRLGALNTRKARFQFVATASLLAGILLLTLNYVIVVLSGKSPETWTCKNDWTSIICTKEAVPHGSHR